ncbi:WGS project CADU00000000 data, contig 00001346, related [Eimeria praecox]|uniref:WGS project CADU00000000 data, contig 00001346, related n=1 Tax=Eimeria praecox TaxID=51316 RepID=U6G520_9EIME|nr:WGS project CADU00000000 data, contig 00001346, related [Eimeria praecox]
MEGRLEPVLEGNVDSEAVLDQPSVTPANEVAASREQVPTVDKQGAQSRRRKDSLQRLGRITIPSVFLAFTAGLLLGTHLPLQQVQSGISSRPPIANDNQTQQIPSEVPASEPLNDEAARGGSEMYDEDLSDPQLQYYDAWGVPSLEHFERTLPKRLREGKEEVASLLRNLHSPKYVPDSALKDIEKIAARALSGGVTDELVGVIFKLRDVELVKPTGEDHDAPRSVRCTGVLNLRYPCLLIEVEDMANGNKYAMRVRLFSSRKGLAPHEEESLLSATHEWEEAEEAIARQASCGISPLSMTSQKGLATPMYVGNIDNVPNVILRDKFYFFTRVQFIDRLHNEFDLGSLVRAGLSMNAKEYVAHRLLLIVLKMQETLLSHNDLDWDNIYAYPDGSFVLSGFDSSVPFGRAVGVHVRISGKNLEPTFRLQEDLYAANAVPSEQSDLWSLGMLLFDLFTGGKLPYTENVEDYTKNALSLAKHLIDKEVEPVKLAPVLNAAKCPVRWEQLILKLLHPVRGLRIPAWGIIMDFPDLVGHRLPR